MIRTQRVVESGLHQEEQLALSLSYPVQLGPDPSQQLLFPFMYPFITHFGIDLASGPDLTGYLSWVSQQILGAFRVPQSFLMPDAALTLTPLGAD